MSNTIVEKLKKEIEGFVPDAKLEHVGRVVSVGDGIAEIEGLGNAVMSEMVLFEEANGKPLKDALAVRAGLYGVLVKLEEESVKAIVPADSTRLHEGMVLKSTGKVLSIPVGEALIGRVVNPLAEPIDE